MTRRPRPHLEQRHDNGSRARPKRTTASAYRNAALLIAALALAAVPSCDRNCVGCGAGAEAADPPNQPPTATAQSVVVEEDASIAIQLAGTDPDGSVTGYRVVDQPQQGTLTGTAPALTYTPAADFNGTDSFTFVATDNRGADSDPAQVSIEVTPVNDSPVATAQAVDVSEDGSVAIELSGTDPDGSVTGYRVVDQPQQGTLTGTAPALTYTPAADFNGTDSFTFVATDNRGADSDPAQVSIEVTPVNDSPVATAREVDVSEDGSVAIELSGTDAEGSIGGYEVVTEPENGELSGDPPSLTYTPNMDFNGTDGFLFSVVDGDDVTSEPARVSINVTPVNDAPVAVAQSLTITDGESIDIVLEGTDIDGTVESYEVLTEAQHGTLTRTPPEVTYTPNADFSGQDTFTFNVTDNEGATSASAEVVIEVAPCADDRDVLEALYHATSGDDWGENSGWLTAEELHDWHGVRVEDGCVVGILLPDNGLRGTIPWQLMNLRGLRALGLDGNSLSGAIPPELGNLTDLVGLDLGPVCNVIDCRSNELTGAIPWQLGNLTNLQTLDLGGNQLTESIPAELGNLTRLEWMDLSANQLTGSIPDEIGNLANLEHLDLALNRLTGPIPKAFGNLTQIVRMALGTNQLTGALPAELDNLENLRDLYLSNNQLSGPIPGWLPRHIDLRRLHLAHNELEGSIPPELANIEYLQSLDLAANKLTGSIPEELGRLSHLRLLSLDDNALTGSIPATLGMLPMTEGTLQLAGNDLSGTVPVEIADLTELWILGLDRNQLSGRLPAAMTGMTRLRVLLFDDNDGLCAPADEDFQTWLEGVNRSTGPTCE